MLAGHQKKRKVSLPRWYRVFLFWIMLSSEGAMNISSGLLSSATKEIKKSLNMNDSKFGMFGTANGLGRVIGSLMFGLLNIKLSRKWLQTLNVGFHALFLVPFKFTDNGIILIFMRGLTGLTQMTPSIYLCVWIDQYGIGSFKTIQITCVQLCQTSGKCIGYLINMHYGLDHWQEGFILEAIYLFICFLCCLISGEDFFSRTLYPKYIHRKKNHNKIEENVEEQLNERLSYTIYEDKDIEIEAKSSFFSDLIILFKNPLYILSLLSRCVLHGLNTCLHFWLCDFIRTVIHEENQLKITLLYSLICFAGPIGGILTNSILRPCIGGYETRKSSWPLVILQSIASIFAISIGFMKTTLSITIITILYLTFNSTALPLVQGILISCVEPELAATGFAIASILTQSLFSGATPFIYGFINDRYKDKYPWLAMVSIMLLQLLAVPVLILLAILRNKKFDEEEKLKEQETDQELTEQ
jgi:predicted MFS family arabinose efflux permease